MRMQRICIARHICSTATSGIYVEIAEYFELIFDIGAICDIACSVLHEN